MKKYLVKGLNAALAGATALTLLMVAAPAKADQNGDAAAALLFGLLFGTVIANDNHDHHHDQYRNWDNDPRKPGYAQGRNDPNTVCRVGVEYEHGWAIRTEYNCWGEVVNVQRWRR